MSVSATIDGNASVDELVADLAELGDVRIMRDRAVVALVGERLLKTPGVPGKALAALSDINVEMISLGANEINLSLVVERGQAAEAQRQRHQPLQPAAPVKRFARPPQRAAPLPGADQERYQRTECRCHHDATRIHAQLVEAEQAADEARHWE